MRWGGWGESGGVQSEGRMRQSGRGMREKDGGAWGWG